MMQGYIQRGYKLFTERVADGRNMKTGQVEKLAEGRVWTGRQAVENGLADANGNLQTAIKKAASLAQIKRLPYGIRTDSVPLVRGFV